MLDLSDGLASEEEENSRLQPAFINGCSPAPWTSLRRHCFSFASVRAFWRRIWTRPRTGSRVAWTKAEDAGQPALLGEVELLEGRLAQSRGSHRLALAKLTAAAEKLQAEDGNPRPDVTIALASAERTRGELAQALERLKSIPSSVLDTELAMRAEYLDELGAVYLARGEYSAAVDTLSEALQLDARINKHEYKSGRSRLLLAEAYLGQNRRPRSKRLIQEAMEIFEQAETGLSEAFALLGAWYEEGGEYAAGSS